jgi:hypothetical protein
MDTHAMGIHEPSFSQAEHLKRKHWRASQGIVA